MEDQLQRLLGDVPERRPISVETIKVEQYAGFRLETLLLELNGLEKVPAYVAIPGNGESSHPLVVFNHSHGGNYAQGKRELIHSSAYLQEPSFVETLTGMGYAVCCIDMWGFGDRSGKTESEIVKEMLWRGRVMWGMMLYDNQRLLDYMCERPDIDASRVATIGMSMGGLMSWWFAALDQRVKVVIDICAQVDAETLIERRGLDHHGFYSYVPGLLKYYSTLDIQRRIAPRPRMSLVGKNDRLCPLAGVEKLASGLAETYEAAGCSTLWQPVIVDGGHRETAEMRALWSPFLQQHL